MAAVRPVTPSNNDLYAAPSTAGTAAPLSRGYSAASHNAALAVPGNTEAMDLAQASGNPGVSSPLSQSLRPNGGKFEENFDASVRGSSILEGDGLQRSGSTGSNLNQGSTPARSGTLKKKNSLSRKSSLKRSGSRRSLHAGSITGVNAHEDASEPSSLTNVFFTPVPTSGSPTEILANRFQAWRKLLKDLITYFREVQNSYEQRAKALLKVSNVINNTNAPSIFLSEGGLNDANRILRDYHKQSVLESNKARDVENEVIAQLNGLRADLAQKIKEIKGLSGDFKNSVEKEKEGTRRAVAALSEALAAVDTDPAAINGKGDPYVVRLNVDRQVERQIDEENYLHGAYLNLEGSGRQLEAIVVGEIQKAYNALAGILKRDADEAYSTVERLRNGPIAIPRELEWTQFIENDSHFVSPRIPLRRAEDIEYPGKHHPAAAEVRAGMLERKSKYLKSYTPGWYVLSPTHLHEFKSADRLYTQPPVMSLYLPDQKLGSHSQPGSSSHKFMIKGRQTGSMHRGHSWVFRAESYDTMLAWFEDIKNLTEKRGEERDAFVRRHARSISAGSNRSVSSDGGMDEDEADRVPYSADASVINQAAREPPPQRPSPGGRFPSDIQVNRDLRIPPSPSSGASEVEHDLTTAAGGLHHDQSYFNRATPQQEHPTASQPLDHVYQGPSTATTNDQSNGYNENYASSIQPTPQPSVRRANPLTTQAAQPAQVSPAPAPSSLPNQPDVNGDTTYSDRSAMAAGGALTGVGIGALANDAYHQRSMDQQQQQAPYQNGETTNQHQNFNQYHQPASIAQETATFAPAQQNIIAPVPIAQSSSLLHTQSSIASPSTSVGTSLVDTDVGAYDDDTPSATPLAAPQYMRQNTDVSASDLPVPGKYPRSQV